jgi:hypothetical protein
MTHCCIKSILHTVNDFVSFYKESIYFRIFVILYLLTTIGTTSFGTFCISAGNYFPQGCWIIFTIGCLLCMMLVTNLLIFFLADCVQIYTNDDLDLAERGESRRRRQLRNASETGNTRETTNRTTNRTTNVLSSTDNIKKLSKRELVQIVEELTEDDSDSTKEITESKYKSPKKLKNKKKKVVESETEESEIEESPKKEKKIEKTKKSSVLASDLKSDEKIKEDPTKFTQENPIVKIKKEETTKVDKETKIEKKK